MIIIIIYGDENQELECFDADNNYSENFLKFFIEKFHIGFNIFSIKIVDCCEECDNFDNCNLK